MAFGLEIFLCYVGSVAVCIEIGKKFFGELIDGGIAAGEIAAVKVLGDGIFLCVGIVQQGKALSDRIVTKATYPFLYTLLAHG